MTYSSLFNIAQIGYTAAAVLYMAFAVSERRGLRRLGRLAAVLGLAVQSLGLALWMAEAGRLPLTNTYETLLLFSWLTVVFTLVLEFHHHASILGAFTLPVAFLLLAATSLVASDIQPVLPSLKSNWLFAHVITCFLSYAAFAVAFGAAALYLTRKALERVRPDSRLAERLPSAESLDSLTFHAITLGFPLLTIGIVTGSVWANLCWGTYWGWDPKETWSLVTWLIYGACLHFRFTSGWHGKYGATAAVVGFVCVLFTYFGVNYLMAGLHSYA